LISFGLKTQAKPADRLSVGDLDERHQSSRQPLEDSSEFKEFEDKPIQRLHDGIHVSIITSKFIVQLTTAAAA